MRVPYAVNALAVAYYLERGRRLRVGKPAPDRFMAEWASSLRYRGQVTAVPRYVHGNQVFTNVHVARLELDYRFGFGAGYSFSAKRVVVLNPEGQVVAVYGDTTPEVWVYGGAA